NVLEGVAEVARATGFREEGTGPRQRAQGPQFLADLLFALLGELLWQVQQVAQAEVIVLPLQHRGALATALLDDVCQLMCQQVPARSTRRGVLSGTENDVAADRIAVRVNIARRLRGDCIVMYPDPGKVLTVVLFHVATNAGIQRAPFASQGRVDT